MPLNSFRLGMVSRPIACNFSLISAYLRKYLGLTFFKLIKITNPSLVKGNSQAFKVFLVLDQCESEHLPFNKVS